MYTEVLKNILDHVGRHEITGSPSMHSLTTSHNAKFLSKVRYQFTFPQSSKFLGV